MKKLYIVRRLLCIALAVSVLLPSISLVVEAASATWLSPLPGQNTSGRYVEVSVGYNTQSSLRVTKLELWIDGQFHSKKMLVRPETRGVCSFSWDTSGYANGIHELIVKIYAGSTLVGVVSGSGTVGESIYDMAAPKVKFVGLKNGSTIKGTTTIKVEANDNSGNAPLISILVDQKLKLLKNSAPYSYDLDTTAYVDGQHQIDTYAFDSEGNKSDVLSIKVNVKNTPAVQAVAKPKAVIPPAAVITKKIETVKPIAPAIAPVVSTINTAARTSDVSEKTIAPLVSAAPVIKTVSQLKPIKTTAEIKPAPVKITLSEPVYTVSKNETPVKPVAEKRTVNNVALVSAKMSASTVPVTVTQVVVKSAAVVASNKTNLKSLSEPPTFKIASSPKVNAASKSMAGMSVKPASGIKDFTQTSMVTKPVKPEPVIKMTPDVKSSPLQIVKVADVAKAEPVKQVSSSRVIVPVKPVDNSKLILANTLKIKQDAQISSVAFPAIKSETPQKTKVTSMTVKPVVEPKPVIMAKSEIKTSSVVLPISKVDTPVKTAVTPMTANPVVESKSVVDPVKPIVLANPVVAVKPVAAVKPVQMAMAPAVEKSYASEKAYVEPKANTTNTLSSTLPIKGKIKVRDLVNKVGGVVLWDYKTRTVTTYSDSIKIEMRIGSKQVMVNGKLMIVNLVPALVKGRTVIDVQLYHKACQIAASDAVKKQASIN